jgi:hypothetical protein
MIKIIETDSNQAFDLLEKDIPEHASYIWQENYEAYYNEMCLAVLVAVRHQVERELVLIASRITDRDEIDWEVYRKNVEKEEKVLRDKKQVAWKELANGLQLKTFPDWKSMEVLRFLTNLYKHDAFATPKEELLRSLKMPLSKPYAPLAESKAVKEALAAYLGLEKGSEYCDIASDLISCADRFIAEVKDKAKPKMSKLKWRAVGFDPDSLFSG